MINILYFWVDEEIDNDEMDLVSDDSEEDEYEVVPNPQGEGM